MIKIGTVEIEDFPVMLAPMEGVTDSIFRIICKKNGADILFTEFVAADGIIREIDKSLQKLKIDPRERPVAIQIFGNNEEAMRMAAQTAETAKPDFIDINWGCPVKKIASKGSGSGILNNIPKMISITKEVVKSVSIPVTVKTRLGYDESSKPIVEIAEQLQDIGICAISIHGRTRSQMYKGTADWRLIAEVKNNPRMKIPVFGNGDITDAKKALEYKNRYGVDGILIGRAAIGNPWIFNEVKTLIHHNKETDPVPIVEKASVCIEHLQGTVSLKGEKKAILEMRPFYSGYFKAIPDFKQTKIKLVTSTDLNEILQILNQIKDSK